MPEYIKKEEAIEMLCAPITMSMCLSVSECQNKEDQRTIDAALIKTIPAVDVAPVRHGRWIAIDGEWIDWKCSECGIKRDGRTPYCPNCGCKMDKEE